MSEPRPVIIFVEDPGAANFVAELPQALKPRGVDAVLLAYGPAPNYLEQRTIREFVTADEMEPREMLDRFRPAAVVVGTSENPRTPGLALIPASARLGIPTIGVVDAPHAATHRFRGTTDDPLAYAPDRLLVPDAWSKQQYTALGYPEGQVLVCGHPHYDFVRKFASQPPATLGRVRNTIYPTAPDGIPIVVFAADLSTGLDPGEWRWSPDYTLTGRGGSVSRTEIVLEEFLDAVNGLKTRPFCALRLHPKGELAQFTSYLDEFDQVTQKEHSLDVILGADAVVGMTTMLLLEAVLLGKPTLSIIPREVERSWLATVHYGLTPVATYRQQVQTAVGHLLRERPRPDQRRVAELLPSGSLSRAAAVIEAAAWNGLSRSG